MSATRDDLIAIQQRWVQDLKDRIFESEDRQNKELDEYYDEYRVEFRKGYERKSSREELVKKLAEADIGYFGDFHTLRIAQRTYVTLMQDIHHQYGKPLVFGLEMVRASHQVLVNEFMEGGLAEKEFLKLINYESTWGFSWENYRPIFDLAREVKGKVIALNSEHPQPKRSLHKRDCLAARLIATASVLWPDHFVGVLFGDLHVGETHLPARVVRELRFLQAKRKDLIVYQNSETLYWNMVSQAIERDVDVVKMSNREYCVMNSTPLVKFQSWLNWQEAGHELEFQGISGRDETNEDIASQFDEMIESISSVLHVEAEGLDDYQLYTSRDLNFIDNLVRKGVYSAAEALTMREIIEQRQSALFTKARIVYLGNLSINTAAAMATRFVRYCCVPDAFDVQDLSPKDAFYVSIFEEVIETIGVLIMNGRFRVMTRHDHEERLENLHRRRLNDKERLQREVSRHVVEHLAMVDRILENDWAKNNLRAVYHLPPELYRSVTRGLGRILGARLYGAMMSQTFRRSQVRDLFTVHWQPGEAWRAYISFTRQVRDLGGEIRPMSRSL